MSNKDKKRVFAKFYKKLFDKKWMQKTDFDIEWHHSSEEDFSSLSSPDSITSQCSM